jgi:hypothetical protein
MLPLIERPEGIDRRNWTTKDISPASDKIDHIYCIEYMNAPPHKQELN